MSRVRVRVRVRVRYMIRVKVRFTVTMDKAYPSVIHIVGRGGALEMQPVYVLLPQ